MTAPTLRRILLAALCATTLAARPAAAQQPLTLGTWSLFEWFLGIGPVEGDGFSLAAAQRTRVRITDGAVTGDAFDVFVNGVLFPTPSVVGGTPTGAFDGDAAWAAPGLSRAELFLDPGAYTITVAVRETGSGFDYGEGFLRADAAPLPTGPGTTVPEPATLGLTALGLAALATSARRGARRRPRG